MIDWRLCSRHTCGKACLMMALPPIASESVNMAITSIGTSGIGPLQQVTKAAPAREGTGFAETLDKLITNVEDTAGSANKAVTDMLNGTGEVHDAMIALHEAEEAVEITVAIRNKFVQAYQDIMRMAI